MLITIQKIWPLDPQKDSGGFKGTDGSNYYCELPAHALLAEGMSFESPARPYVSKSTGKTSYIMPKGWRPPNTVGAIIPQTAQNGHTPAPPAGNGYVPEMEKQGYIMCSVMMKILADAQNIAGKPVETQDMALFAQCATAVWRDHLKGKV